MFQEHAMLNMNIDALGSHIYGNHKTMHSYGSFAQKKWAWANAGICHAIPKCNSIYPGTAS